MNSYTSTTKATEFVAWLFTGENETTPFHRLFPELYTSTTHEQAEFSLWLSGLADIFNTLGWSHSPAFFCIHIKEFNKLMHQGKESGEVCIMLQQFFDDNKDSI